MSPFEPLETERLALVPISVGTARAIAGVTSRLGAERYARRLHNPLLGTTPAAGADTRAG